MAVPCSVCGREYDVALFAFGRTIHCTCGARVGVEPRRRRSREAGRPPRLAADAMLGRLARWLRLLGLDVFWQAQIDDAELVRRAIEEERVLLTRDRELAEAFRVSDLLVLRPDRPEDQLREVCRALGLERHFRPFTRCSVCNTPLVEAAPDSLRGEVPERILREQRRIDRCRRCGRVYWRGSHTERLLERLCRVLDDADLPDSGQ
jgi:uncharacterized protein with PIN domain